MRSFDEILYLAILTEMSKAPLNAGFPDLPIDPEHGKIGNNLDLLGLDPHAEALASFISMCSTPMTIGIQGDWGSGKTSLMNLVRAKLDKKGFLSIWFNTWQYSQFGNEGSLASSLLINLMKKLKSKGNPSHRVWGNVSRFIRGVVQASKVNGGVISVEGKELVQAFEDDGLDDVGLFEEMKQDFAKVVDDVLAQREVPSSDRIVIYIDDLDRLSPSKAVELLEAMKNILDVPGCIFVLAIDYDVVIRGLRQRKDYSIDEFRSSDGRNFFDKIIQVPYRMPIERYSTQKFVQDHFTRIHGGQSEQVQRFFSDHAPELIRLSVGNNPRGLKRVLNIHALFSHLPRDEQGGSEHDEDDRVQVITFALACIQVAVPLLYTALAKYRNSFQTLVALCDRGTYELIAESDDSDKFDSTAERLSRSIRKHRGGVSRKEGNSEEEDDDDTEVQMLRDIVNDLRRFLPPDDKDKQSRARRLADIVRRALDLDGDGLYSDAELGILNSALRVSSSTSVEDVEVKHAPTRKHVGFRELAEDMSDVFSERPNLIFRDPATGTCKDDCKRTPHYEREISHLKLLINGESVGLKAETMSVLKELEISGRERSRRECSGHINATDYWVVEGDDDARPLTSIREEWKSNYGYGGDK